MRVWAAILLALSACGGSTAIPKRRVVEGRVDGWNFRRYQQVVDVEVWVSKTNPAVAHTASYVRNSAEVRGHIDASDVANAFVTEYKTDVGVVRALVRFARRLAQESGYVVEEKSISGVRVISVSGQGEAWALWPSGRFVVKIGGPGLEGAPAALVEEYGGRYPSRLPREALEGPLPTGPEEPPPATEPYDPSHPKPDWKAGQKK